jgi:hypothetical protein
VPAAQRQLDVWDEAGLEGQSGPTRIGLLEVE